MTQVVSAVYENGMLRPLQKLALNEKEEVQVTIEPCARRHADGDGAARASDPLAGLRVATGIPDLAENFDDYRLGRRKT